MSFRLLVWNIQFFTKSRINDDSGASEQERTANQMRTLANLLYILSTVKQADPDVFVVLEVRSSQGDVGKLASGGGPDGLVYLLAQMRSMLSPNWYLVPPLRVNPREIHASSTYTEAVGVFWRNDRVNFTGPWWWPSASPNGPPIAPGQDPSKAGGYPSPWDTCVPGGAAFTRAPFLNAVNSDGKLVVLADPEKTNYARRPVLTTFQELGGMGRYIKLFSVHTKPTQARAALIQLGSMYPPLWQPANNQVAIFAGDFNLNLLKDTSAAEDHDLSMFQQDGHTLMPLYLVNNEYPPSVFYSRYAARPDLYLKQAVYDYAFVTYGTGAIPPNPASVVADRVSGVAAPGLPAFTSDMKLQLPALNTNMFPASKTVNIANSPGGASRQNEVTTITTNAAHGIMPGTFVTVAGVSDNSFNGDFQVVSVPGATTFTYAQKDAANSAAQGGGTVDVLPRLNAFRARWNFGHIGPPAGEGTSDHLPVFMLI